MQLYVGQFFQHEDNAVDSVFHLIRALVSLQLVADDPYDSTAFAWLPTKLPQLTRELMPRLAASAVALPINGTIHWL